MRAGVRFVFISSFLLCFAVAIPACGSSDDEQGTDDADATDVTATSEPDEDSTSTALSSDPVEDATAYWEAMAAGDREAALSAVDPAALETGGGSPFGRAHTLDGQFDWYESVGWEWTLGECVEGDTGGVECTATASNSWSDALGVEPVTGTFLVQFSNDGITEVAEQFDSFISQWGPMVFLVFAEWVEMNHPDDAEVMFDFAVDVNPEILTLYEVNTDRFVQAQQGG